MPQTSFSVARVCFIPCVAAWAMVMPVGRSAGMRWKVGTAKSPHCSAMAIQTQGQCWPASSGHAMPSATSEPA